MVERGNELFRAVAAQVAKLQDAEVSDDDVEKLLLSLTGGAVAAIPDARHASITVVERGEVVTIASTDPVAERVDELQTKHDIGPCLDAAWEQHPVLIEDYTTDERWPRFIEDVVAQTAVRSSLSFQLHRDETSMSAFNIHADSVHAFDAEAQRVGSVFAANTALALHSQTWSHQFDEALASRDDIGQAKGILMERYTVDADQAFAMLKQISQTSNTKLVELARRLIDIDHPSHDQRGDGTDSAR
ncbi:GAF and ANTAR domain-containing protein [Williamsia phyllosphaerae]|uniref:Transcriptional regulator n=1 Tax=Williamsia phyllosphaerae TaxID=885042 RepID=A0ABQ1UHE7_9NOCA|nr:GAF and ANTAR domain-containing protein [Williamsia phyllosphaerae]GGF18883.1 transcriptional regulator [Williamsia phyllosphaerae]